VQFSNDHLSARAVALQHLSLHQIELPRLPAVTFPIAWRRETGGFLVDGIMKTPCEKQGRGLRDGTTQQ